MKNKKIKWDKIQFPIVKNISAKTIAQDIKGFDPSNPQDVADWKKQQKKMWTSIKEKFDAKGIPMPTVVLDTTPGPITYGIKTTDENGNILHTLISPKNEFNKRKI